jgi:hypothetical protein
MTDDEINRLNALVSEVERPVRAPLSWYITDIMPPDLTEDETLQWVFNNY